MKNSREGLLKVATFFAVIVVAALLHWAVSLLVPAAFYEQRVIFEIGRVMLALMRVEDHDIAFGLSVHPSAWISIINTLVMVSLTTAVLIVVSRKNIYQFIALSALFGSGILSEIEKIVFGYNLDYFYIGYGPVFSIFDVTWFAGLVLLYILVILQFFRLGPFKKKIADPAGNGTLHDPLYDSRNSLRVIFLVWGILVVLMAISNLPMARDLVPGQPVSQEAHELGLESMVMPMAEQAATTVRQENRFFIVTIQALHLALWMAIYLTPLIILWLLIPKSRIHVLYLRSFQSDKGGWASARRLRKALRPGLRLTGVVDPGESRRPIYLAYWLIQPFVFAIGDMGRVNVLRHNVFLEGDWKSAISSAFSSVKAAVFDCRSFTPYLIWEIKAGIEKTGPDRAFFLLANGYSPEELRRNLVAHNLEGNVVDMIRTGNCFQVADLSKLATMLRQLA